MIKRVFLFWLLFLFTFSSFPTKATEKFVTVVSPVRGRDFWQLENQSPLDFVSFQKRLFNEMGVASTWLLRPDVLFDSDLFPLFNRSEFKDDEVGIFLEVTPSWTQNSGVVYNEGGGWSLAENVFLSGYNPEERRKLLKSAFEKFREIFGHYPKTIGAWHIDPYVANLAREGYGVEAVLICADQFSTDGYRVWGGWWGVPFYPSKKNLLVPAARKQDKLDVVVLWWAARDPLNGYGPSVFESTFSVQVNDYLTYHNLNVSYFSGLADFYLNPQKGEFGQLTIGLENDNDLRRYGEPFKRQVTILKQKGVIFITASEFASWYKSRFPNFSPPHQIGGKDLLGTQKEAKWIMDKNKRIGLIKEDDKWIVRDLRFYQPPWPDPYLRTKNLAGELYWSAPAKIDLVGGIGEAREWNERAVQTSNNSYPYEDSWLWVFPVLLVFLICMRLFKPPFKALVLIVLGGSIFSLTMIRSGRLYDFGMGFWGPNGHDGIWHLSLMNQVVKKIPPQNPVFAGEVLRNYHWGFDLLAGWLTKLLPFSSLDIYFRLLPITFAFLIGFLSFCLGRLVTKNFWVGFWFVFLNFFAGSFGWIVTLLREGKIGGESLFWSMQSISTLINPPYTLSLIVLLVGIIIWFRKRHLGKWYEGAVLGILFGILVGVKVYAGILIGLSLFSFWCLQKFKNKGTHPFDFWIWATTGLVSIITLFLIGVSSSKPSLVFAPFWFVHSLVESFDKLYLPKVAVLRINLAANWLSWKLPFLLFLEVFLLGIFILGNMGTRILGWFDLARKIIRKQLGDFDLLMMPLFFYALVFPLFFVQRGTTWNTIQFFYYFLFFSNFYLALFLARLTKSKTLIKKLFLFLILLLTLPTTASTLKEYLGFPSPATIPYYELEGLEFLKKQPGGIVLTFPYDKFKRSGVTAPLPLYLYESTAYVSALTGKTTFLEDEMNLEITGYPWKERRKETEKFFSTQDRIWSRGFLLNNNIDYIYLVNDQKLPLQTGDLGLDVIFDNGQVRIYKVLK